MSRAIAFLAGMGAGHMDEKRRKEAEAKADARERRAQAREDARDARDAANHEYVQGERARVDADRTELRAAAAPVTVVEEELAGPTMPDEPPLPSVAKVNGRTFADRGVAQAEADKANTPEGRLARINSTADRIDPAGAQQRHNQALQGEAAKLSLKEATRKALNEGGLDAMGAAMNGASPEEVKALFNRFGERRVAELAIEPFEFDHPTLGKQKSARMVGKFEDGTPLNIPDAFSSSLDLFGKAKKFDLLTQWARDKANRDDKVADNERQDRRDKSTMAHQERMAGIAAAKGSGAAGGVAQVSLKDMRDFEGDVDKIVASKFDPKDGQDPAEKARIVAQATAVKAAAMGVFEANATRGRPITAAIAVQAMELAQNRKAVRIVQDEAGNSFEAVVVNGQPVLVSGAMQRKPAPAAAAPAAVAPPPAAAPAARPPAAAQAAAGVPQQQAQQQVAAAIPQQHEAALAPMNQQLVTLAAQLAAAAKSGDQAAVQNYSQQLMAARATRDKAALQLLGPNVARQYLSQLPV